MDRDHVVSSLRAHAQELQCLGVAHLFLFGAVARDEATLSSDVDLFFDFENPRFSVIELLRAQRRVEEILSAPADVMTRGSLHPRLRSDIERSAVQVF